MVSWGWVGPRAQHRGGGVTCASENPTLGQRSNLEPVKPLGQATAQPSGAMMSIQALHLTRPAGRLSGVCRCAGGQCRRVRPPRGGGRGRVRGGCGRGLVRVAGGFAVAPAGVAPTLNLRQVNSCVRRSGSMTADESLPEWADNRKPVPFCWFCRKRGRWSGRQRRRVYLSRL